MKPQIRPDQVCAELAFWHAEVIPNLPTLHTIAYPPPAADIDAVRVQNSTQPSPADRIGHPARELWFRHLRVAQRQSAASERIERLTGGSEPGTVWQRFVWSVTRRSTFALAADLPCPQVQWIHDEHPDIWDDLHALLLVMDPIRADIWALMRAGAGPGWKPGNAGMSKGQKDYLRRKLHDRQARGLSEYPTEREVGIQ